MTQGKPPAGSPPAHDAGTSATLAFVFFILLAGGNAIAVRYSNAELPPFWGAFARLAAAALIFWVLVLLQRAALPRGRALLGVLLYGAVGIGAANAFIYWALVRARPGLASVFLAFVPLATVLLSAAHGTEALTRTKLAGALIGAAGIALIVSGRTGTDVTPVVLLALLMIPFALAEGTVIIKIFRPGNPMVTNAIGMTVGAILMGLLTAITGETPVIPSAPQTWAAFAYIAVFGSVFVFYLWLVVLAAWPASRSAYGFLLMPVVTISLSALLTGEGISTTFVAGAAIAMLGVWLGAIRPAQLPAVTEPAGTEYACMPTC